MSSVAPAIDPLLLKKYGLEKAPSSLSPQEKDAYIACAQNYANVIEIYTNPTAEADADARIVQAKARVAELRRRARVRARARAYAEAHGTPFPPRRPSPNRPGPIARARAELQAIEANQEKIKALLELQKEDNLGLQTFLIENLAGLCVLIPAVEQEKTKDTPDIPTIADNVMRAAFAAGFVLALAALLVATPALAIAAISYGFIWNFIDMAAGALGIDYGKERSSDHNKFLDALQAFSAIQLGIGTELALINTLGGFGPAAFGCLGGVTFAVCMWISAAQEAHYTYRALRKVWDTNYFIDERKQAIAAETRLLSDRRTWLDRLLGKEPILPTEKQLQKSHEKIKVMTKQVEALEYYNQHKNDPDNSSIDNDGRQKMAIAHILIAKEKEKAKEHAIKCAVWMAAGAVMTAAIFCMPPVVVALGLVVGLAKGGQIVQSLVNKDYSEKAIQAVKNQTGNAAKDLEVFKDELLTKAIENLYREKLNRSPKDEDVKAIKDALSEKHKEQLIYTQARADYNPLTYLSTKASEAKEATQKAVSTLSSKFCGFFSGTPSPAAAMVEPLALTNNV